jgi:hypothetical protein
MKGLNPQQFQEILKYIQDNHAFYHFKEGSKSIKYIDSCYDSRFGDIWVVKFRGFQKWAFSTNHFNVMNPKPKNFTYDNLYVSRVCAVFVALMNLI